MARKQNSHISFWNDKHGHFVVWQRPNALLMTWFGAFVLTVLLPTDWLGHVFSFVALIAILIWAVMELGWGVNYFRRSLGLGVILIFVASHVF